MGHTAAYSYADEVRRHKIDDEIVGDAEAGAKPTLATVHVGLVDSSLWPWNRATRPAINPMVAHAEPTSKG